MSGPMELAIGPLLFNWAPDRVETFYARIADEAPVKTVAGAPAGRGSGGGSRPSG